MYSPAHAIQQFIFTKQKLAVTVKHRQEINEKTVLMYHIIRLSLLCVTRIPTIKNKYYQVWNKNKGN